MFFSGCTNIFLVLMCLFTSLQSLRLVAFRYFVYSYRGWTWISGAYRISSDQFWVCFSKLEFRLHITLFFILLLVRPEPFIFAGWAMVYAVCCRSSVQTCTIWASPSLGFLFARHQQHRLSYCPGQPIARSAQPEPLPC